jgi:EmrB/QacA subfamily drug resistance transporter
MSQRWTLVLASLGCFMTALDTLVVTTALPVLRTSLHTNLAGLEWTVNAYNLAFACFLLTGAAVGDRFGRRRMFCVGIGAFALASAAAALATTPEALIAARAVQGAAAAIVAPLSLTLISEAFPVEKRGAAIGLWGGIGGLAVAAGPVVGGAIVNGLDWHWMFWINVPLGLVLVPLCARKLTESYGPSTRLDLAGLALATIGAFGLTWGLVRATDSGWASPEVLTSLIGGALFVTLFFAWERRSDHPMVPPSLFRVRGFATANAVSFCMYAGLFGALFLMSQLLQTGLGYSPLQAGLRLLPWTFTPMVFAPIAGSLADRFGNRPFMVFGLACQAAGLAWVAAIAKTGMGYDELAFAFTLAGIGTSFTFPTAAGASMAAVTPEQAGIASGVNSACRELGGVFGVAVLASVFAANGGYASPTTFLAGFPSALWVAVVVSAAGIVAAALTAGSHRAEVAAATA